MKLLIHGINFSPELTGIGKYTGEMAAWLANAGVSVRVVTAPPYYPQWQVGQGYSGARYKVEADHNLLVVRSPLWVPSRVSGLKRLAHLGSFAASSFPAMISQGLAWRPDAVFVVEPTFFNTPAALAAARACGAKAWLHVQDLEIDASLSLGLLPKGPPTSLALTSERIVMNRFDMVSSISASMLDKLRHKGVPHEKLIRFDNWVDTDVIKPMGETPPLRAELANKLGFDEDSVIALYSGNMGEKQGLEVLPEAAKLLQNEPKVVFVLCGAGAARQRLQDAAQGLPNVRFSDLVPFERLNELLNMADIHLLPQRPDVDELVMPSKLTGILAAGGALVAAARSGSELSAAVNSAGGRVVEPGDAAALASAVQDLAANPVRRSEMGAQARTYALQHMGKDAILGGFLDQLRSLTGVRD
ncbi:MAG: WcaI family glycosyltransferase [Okeania sp. SIO3B3]|nr:WcaI family glycosyltransferase [Okeania sp. SIO3B3]